MPTSALLAKKKTRKKYTKVRKQTMKEKLLKQNDVIAEKVRKTKYPKKRKQLELWWRDHIKKELIKLDG